MKKVEKLYLNARTARAAAARITIAPLPAAARPAPAYYDMYINNIIRADVARRARDRAHMTRTARAAAAARRAPARRAHMTRWACYRRAAAHVIPSSFERLLRAFENEYMTPDGVTYDALIALSRAIAASVVRKCIDPQSKNNTGDVSDSGCNPAMVELRRGIQSDIADINNLRLANDNATRVTFTDAGDIKIVTADPVARRAADKLIHTTLTDGLDLVHTAAAALMEQAQAHATPRSGWLEREYHTRRVSRRVIIKSNDNALWVDETTTPIQEVYRVVRRDIDGSRAVQTDPRNGYLYIEDMVSDPDGLAPADIVYQRLGKYTDMGGTDCNGNYTADPAAPDVYNDILTRLNLTDRQLSFLTLKLRGYGNKAIATYYGVDPSTVKTHFRRIREKCASFGFTPAMYAEMTGDKMVNTGIERAPAPAPAPRRARCSDVITSEHDVRLINSDTPKTPAPAAHNPFMNTTAARTDCGVCRVKLDPVAEAELIENMGIDRETLVTYCGYTFIDMPAPKNYIDDYIRVFKKPTTTDPLG